MSITKLRSQSVNLGRNAARDTIEEVKAYRPNHTKQNDLKAFLYELHLLRSGNTKLKLLLRSHGLNEHDLTFNHLQKLYSVAIYFKIKRNISSKYESYPTYYETKFNKLLRSLSKTKTYQSYWIGNHCLDIFIPKFRLAIEVDGGIHNLEAKMRKDNFKEDYLLKEFKIYVVHIENSDINSHSLLFQKVFSQKTLNSKSVKRLMRDIYIATISSHLSLEQVQKHINPKLKEAFDHFIQTRSLLKKRRGTKC